MRKLLVMVAVLGIATTAFGASYQMEFGNNGVYDDGPRTLEISPSQLAYIEVWLILDPGMGMSSANTDIAATGDDVNWEWTSLIPGPETGWLVPPPDLPETLNGWVSAIYSTVYGTYISYTSPLLLFTIDIHCAQFPSVDLISFDAAAGEGNEFVREDYGTTVQPTLGTGVTLIQVPEPASLALLALGGLALLRRR